MHPNPKRILPLVVIILLGVGAYYYLYLPSLAKGTAFSVSGTVEANEYHVGSLQGGRVDEVHIHEGDTVARDAILVEVHPNSAAGRATGRELVHAPIDGLVLDRLVEPGEVVGAGAPVVTMIDPNDLSLTVYVPEDRYGQIKLGQTYPVTVDSFPAEVFTGTVSHIADHAEFTPRNVQTTESRKNTVFAIKLTLPQTDGKLKPGMPADVRF